MFFCLQICGHPEHSYRRSCQNKTNTVTTVLSLFSMKTIQRVQVKREERERKDRLKNAAASERKQDIFGATPNTLAEQINHSQCQRCTGSCQVIFFKAETSDCPCVTVRLPVRLTHGRRGLLFQQKPKEKQDVCTTSFLLSERCHKNLILADC